MSALIFMADLMEIWAYLAPNEEFDMLCQNYILESQVEGNQHNQIIACNSSTVLIILPYAHNKIFKRATFVVENNIKLYFLKIVGKLFISFGNRSAVIYMLCLQTPQQKSLSVEQ
jgi:hypothetical protein